MRLYNKANETDHSTSLKQPPYITIMISTLNVTEYMVTPIEVCPRPHELIDGPAVFTNSKNCSLLVYCGPISSRIYLIELFQMHD